MSQKVVNHPKYGSGVVMRSRNGGFELYVAFTNGLKRWVRFDELHDPLPLRTERLVAAPAATSADSSFQARKMIEAFRLGIVPYNCVMEFTFGREPEVRRLMAWLSDPDEPSLALVGEYGTGKTHLLQYLYSRAMMEGFAVAYAEVDPDEAPFHKPKRVYGHLVRTFCYPGGDGRSCKRFRDFIREALDRGGLSDHYYFKHLIGRDEELFWEWIEGGEAAVRPQEWAMSGWGYLVNKYSYLPGLYDYATAANVYCYLLSGLSWAAHQVLGLKGLLLLFDEAETMPLHLSKTVRQKQMEINFLKALTLTAEDEPRLLDRADVSGLEYCGHAQHIPFIYKVPTGLKLLFSFTESAFDLPKLEVEGLSDTALREVFKHVCGLYQKAYGLRNVNNSIVDAGTVFRRVSQQGGRTRMFVKGAVEALDLIRTHPGRPIDEVLN